MNLFCILSFGGGNDPQAKQKDDFGLFGVRKFFDPVEISDKEGRGT